MIRRGALQRAPSGGRPDLTSGALGALSEILGVDAARAADILTSLEDAGFVLVQAEFSAHRSKPKPKRDRQCQPHLAWLRIQPCSVPGCVAGPCDAAHVRRNTGGGTGLKPGSEWAVSLCRFHHREQHSIGERAFEERYRIDMRAIAQEFAAASPHLSPQSTSAE